MSKDIPSIIAVPTHIGIELKKHDLDFSKLNKEDNVIIKVVNAKLIGRINMSKTLPRFTKYIPNVNVNSTSCANFKKLLSTIPPAEFRKDTIEVMYNDADNVIIVTSPLNTLAYTNWIPPIVSFKYINEAIIDKLIDIVGEGALYDSWKKSNKA